MTPDDMSEDITAVHDGPPSMPESATPEPLALAIGERVEGNVTSIDREARIALPDGRVVYIDGSELVGEAPVAVGDPISAFVVRLDKSGDIWVSRTRGSAALLLLLNARDHGETVEGKVVAQGPKGLEVDLGGGVFAICPPDEVGDDVDNPGHLVGKSVAFKVKDATPALVTLSRKDVPPEVRGQRGDAERAEAAAEVRRRLRVGATMAGRVSKLREFGAFVDLGGGVEGLVHLSELAHERIAHPKEVVSVGQPVEVQVLKLDYDAHKGERISLSLKALTKSTWDAALAELKEGEKRKGKVQRLESFGAFVELMPGVTGLVHVSALGGKRHAHPNEVLKVGDEIEVEILGVDKDKHRIALKRVPTEAEVAEKRAASAAIREKKRDEARAAREEARKKPHERLQPGDIVDGTVDRIEPYGFFLQLKGGGRGMVHVSEMGPPPEGADPAKSVQEQFPKGTKVKVAVLEIDAEHRIRLSRVAVAELEKGTTAEGYLKHKTQRELEEKLLRSASKPGSPRGRGPGKPRGPRPPNTVADRPSASNGAPQNGAAAKDARPRNKREGGGRPAPKSSGLGTLGDLLKAKLQQRKG